MSALHRSASEPRECQWCQSPADPATPVRFREDRETFTRPACAPCSKMATALWRALGLRDCGFGMPFRDLEMVLITLERDEAVQPLIAAWRTRNGNPSRVVNGVCCSLCFVTSAFGEVESAVIYRNRFRSIGITDPALTTVEEYRARFEAMTDAELSRGMLYSIDGGLA